MFLGSVAFGMVKGESADEGRCKLYYYMSTDYLPPGWTLSYRGMLAPEQPAPPADANLP